ncbi:MAG: gamma-butyrobetaine hydroxylase-like domain-containing protein [Pseudomonadota bacterium]
MSEHKDGASERRFGEPVPSELRLRTGGRELKVSYASGEAFALSAEYLRVHSPSAEVRGHGGPGQENWPVGKHEVVIERIEPVGNYAVRLVFDDGHDSGLYSWRVLYELGRDHDSNWAKYLAHVDGLHGADES